MTIYDNMRRINAEAVYNAGGHYVLTVANLDLFGRPVIAGGYRVVRELEREEALSYICKQWEGLDIIMPVAL